MVAARAPEDTNPSPQIRRAPRGLKRRGLLLATLYGGGSIIAA